MALLTPKDRKRAGRVLILVVLMAMSETFGIAMLLPFFMVLSRPQMIEIQPAVSAAYHGLGFTDHHSFLIAFGLVAFAIVVLAALIRIATTFMMNLFAQKSGHRMAERLLETYLRQPYVFFLQRHSSELTKKITADSQMLVSFIVLPGMYVIAYTLVVLTMTGVMLALDPFVALSVGGVIGGMYVLIYKASKKMLLHIGQDLEIANTQRFSSIEVAIGGIKDIKLMGREDVYLDQFRPASLRAARHQAISAAIAESPRYLIEAVAIGGALTLALLLLATGRGAGLVLPGLSVYALAGYKLIPAAQRVFSGLSNLQVGDSVLNAIRDDFAQTESPRPRPATPAVAMQPMREIVLDNVGFSYPNMQKTAIEGITLTIGVGTSVGLVGGTGAGKTTLVDIILGLLRPSEGRIIVDGVPIDEHNLPSWQQALGYVPQTIFLADTTVAENIALGVAHSAIDMEKVEECARMAQIHDFIVSDMPEGYETRVGERGVRLSGGQRQRIGIARALYRDPSVLVLDEATSALDTLTEKAVMESVQALSHQKTIIMIAHRLTTVRPCDTIFMLDKGGLAEQGNYNELLKSSRKFKAMV
tara:strand:- start:756 stop:2516 length:1761 start_codon:yes stop_codon:yes gene_type:complete